MVELSHLARRFDSTVWLGVGVLGILVFLVGAYTPALASLPDAYYLSLGVAFAGGAIALLGFSCYYDQRQYEKHHPRRRPLGKRAKEIAIAPSLEVYDPRREPPPSAAGESGDDAGPSP